MQARVGESRSSASGPVVVAAGVMLAVIIGPAAALPGAGPESKTTTSASGPSSRPVDPLEEARQAELGGEYDRAVSLYESLLGGSDGRKDDRLTGRLGKARCLAQQGRYADALATLDQTPPELRHADWQGLYSELLAEVGRYAEAIEHGRQALRESPRHFQAAYSVARCLERTGRRDELLQEFSWVPDLLRKPLAEDAAERTYAGLLVELYAVESGELSAYAQVVLHSFFQPAYETLDRRYWPARVAGGDLLAAAYNLIQAEEDFRAALSINPRCTEAQVGLARIRLEDWKFEQVEKHVAAALKVNPHHVGAHEVLANLRMTERKYLQAAQAAADGLAVNPHSLALLSVEAAAYLRAGQAERCQALIKTIQAINPRPWEMHFALGYWLAAGRQFDQAERHYRRAHELAPYRAEPLTGLGLMYMQTGREKLAARKLEAAFAIDDFNQRTFNTLKLLDELQQDFAAVETKHFIVRFDPKRDGILGPCFTRYLERIYPEVCGDYGCRPSRKTIVEVFPTHDKFSVRITALPWIGTVGASTGPVVALTSPRKQARGAFRAFNWARVLRHEFTHTVTLAATKNRIPHWFTEGLAVGNEDAPRPWEWYLQLARATLGGRLFTLESIDWGFVRPRRPGDRLLAYAQSQWMCEYLVERFGYYILQRMLAGYRQGKTQQQVFTELTGAGTEQFDRDFRVWARVQVESWNLPIRKPIAVKDAQSRLSADPTAAELADLAVAQLQAGRLDEAEQSARKALQKDAEHVVALEVLGTTCSIRLEDPRAAGREENYRDQAFAYLTKVAALAPNNATAPKILGRLALRYGRPDEAIKWLRRLKAVCPRDPASYQGLAGIYLKRGLPDKALPEMLHLARSEEKDPRLALQIADIYEQKQQWGQARYWRQQALYLDPFNAEAHARLGALWLRLANPAEAVFQYKMASRLAPKKPRYLQALAEAYRKAGQPDKARQAAQRAAELGKS